MMLSVSMLTAGRVPVAVTLTPVAPMTTVPCAPDSARVVPVYQTAATAPLSAPAMPPWIE